MARQHKSSPAHDSPARSLPDPDFAKSLLRWYDNAAETMPWRVPPSRRDPYRIWLSEVMLQQTRVATVIGYYERFLARFPTVEALAAAPLDEVLKLWEGLGYYARARHLHRGAQAIVTEHGGEFPATAEGLRTLPGIGRYTAAAIASIAFGEAVAVLDGNVVRVLTRLIDLDEEVELPRVQARLWELAEALLARDRAGDYNQALMDLGRTICTPRRPACPRCPVRSFCVVAARGTQERRPVKKAKAPLPQVRATAAVISDATGRVLLVQRPAGGLLGGLWRLPGGDCAAEENERDCLRRALRDALDLEIDVGEELATATQTFTHLHLHVRAFFCTLIAGEPSGAVRCVWAAPEELPTFSFGKADRALLERLKQWQPRLFAEA